MKRAALIQSAARPASELVTDWIPCTALPVRVGRYQIRHPGHGIGMADWDGSRWTDGNDEHFRADGSGYHWRGLRRWVLVRKADPLLSALFLEPTDAYLEDARPRSAKFTVHAKARPFKDERAAQRFADRYSDLGLTAVLP